MTKEEKELFERILQEKTSDNKIKRVLEELDRIKELNNSLSEEIEIYKQMTAWTNSYIDTLNGYLKKLSMLNWRGLIRFKKLILLDTEAYKTSHEFNIYTLKKDLKWVLTMRKKKDDKRRN